MITLILIVFWRKKTLVMSILNIWSNQKRITYLLFMSRVNIIPVVSVQTIFGHIRTSHNCWTEICLTSGTRTRTDFFLNLALLVNELWRYIADLPCPEGSLRKPINLSLCHEQPSGIALNVVTCELNLSKFILEKIHYIWRPFKWVFTV